MAQNESEIRYLTPPSVEIKKKKYCRFKKNKIKYIDYKDPEFLKKFLGSFVADPQCIIHTHIVDVNKVWVHSENMAAYINSPPAILLDSLDKTERFSRRSSGLEFGHPDFG